MNWFVIIPEVKCGFKLVIFGSESYTDRDICVTQSSNFIKLTYRTKIGLTIYIIIIGLQIHTNVRGKRYGGEVLINKTNMSSSLLCPIYRSKLCRKTRT